MKSSERRILCRGRLVADDTSLSSAPVENNDVLLMVRKAPELATATTPPGLRNDPHAPHNEMEERDHGAAGSREDVVAVTATNAGGGSVGSLQRLNIPGLPPGVEVMGGVSSMMIPPNARDAGKHDI